MLRWKRSLISGVATRDSLAAAVVERAHRAGAEAVAAAYARDVPVAEEALAALTERPAVAAVDASADEVEMAMRPSAWTYVAFGRLLPRLAPPSGASSVGLDFDTAGAGETAELVVGLR